MALQEGARAVDSARLQLRRILPREHRDLGIRAERVYMAGLAMVFICSGAYAQTGAVREGSSSARAYSGSSSPRYSPPVGAYLPDSLYEPPQGPAYENSNQWVPCQFCGPYGPSAYGYDPHENPAADLPTYEEMNPNIYPAPGYAVPELNMPD